MSIQNSNEEDGRLSQLLYLFECISVCRDVRCLNCGTYLSNKGLNYLLWHWCVKILWFEIGKKLLVMARTYKTNQLNVNKVMEPIVAIGGQQ